RLWPRRVLARMRSPRRSKCPAASTGRTSGCAPSGTKSGSDLDPSVARSATGVHAFLMAAPARDRGVDVVEIRGSNGPDDGLDGLDGLEVLDPRRRVSEWLILGAIDLLATRGSVGRFAGSTQPRT